MREKNIDKIMETIVPSSFIHIKDMEYNLCTPVSSTEDLMLARDELVKVAVAKVVREVELLSTTPRLWDISVQLLGTGSPSQFFGVKREPSATHRIKTNPKTEPNDAPFQFTQGTNPAKKKKEAVGPETAPTTVKTICNIVPPNLSKNIAMSMLTDPCTTTNIFNTNAALCSGKFG